MTEGQFYREKGLGYRCMQLGEMPWGFFAVRNLEGLGGSAGPQHSDKAEKVTE